MSFRSRSSSIRLPRLLSLLAVVPLTMTIAGCATLRGDPPQPVQIPDDCDRLAEPVPFPVIVKREDLGVRSARLGAALVEANGRLRSTRECNAKVREQFAGGER